MRHLENDQSVTLMGSKADERGEGFSRLPSWRFRPRFARPSGSAASVRRIPSVETFFRARNKTLGGRSAPWITAGSSGPLTTICDIVSRHAASLD